MSSGISLGKRDYRKVAGGADGAEASAAAANRASEQIFRDVLVPGGS